MDQFGPSGHGYQHVQDAIDAATGAATILIAPGTYAESAQLTETSGTNGGFYIDKPDLTLQGVKADGTPITTASDAQSGPTIIAATQADFSADHFIGRDGDHTVIQGLHLQIGDNLTFGKLLEIWADDVTVQNNFLDVNAPNTGYSGAIAIYINDNGTATSEINSYTIDHNILNEGIAASNGVGNPPGIGAEEQITSRSFRCRNRGGPL